MRVYNIWAGKLNWFAGMFSVSEKGNNGRQFAKSRWRRSQRSSASENPHASSSTSERQVLRRRNRMQALRRQSVKFYVRETACKLFDVRASWGREEKVPERSTTCITAENQRRRTIRGHTQIMMMMPTTRTTDNHSNRWMVLVRVRVRVRVRWMVLVAVAWGTSTWLQTTLATMWIWRQATFSRRSRVCHRHTEFHTSPTHAVIIANMSRYSRKIQRVQWVPLDSHGNVYKSLTQKWD